MHACEKPVRTYVRTGFYLYTLSLPFLLAFPDIAGPAICFVLIRTVPITVFRLVDPHQKHRYERRSLELLHMHELVL